MYFARLLLAQNRVRETVERLVTEHEPDVVGLSVITFQRKTAKGIIDLVRTRRPRARVVGVLPLDYRRVRHNKTQLRWAAAIERIATRSDR